MLVFKKVKTETSPRAELLPYFPLKISLQTKKKKVLTFVDVLLSSKNFSAGQKRKLFTSVDVLDLETDTSIIE